MDATLRLVAAQGIAATAVVDIEAASGLAPGRGGFYRHFPSKEDALRAALERELDRLRGRQLEPVDVGAGPECLADELSAGLAWLTELGPLITVVMRDGPSVPDTTRALRKIIATGGMSAGLERAAEAAVAAGRDPVACAVVVTMASIGFHLAHNFLGGPVEGIDAEQFVATLADMVAT
jgi:AcrR family transcriptional regulator